MKKKKQKIEKEINEIIDISKKILLIPKKISFENIFFSFCENILLTIKHNRVNLYKDIFLKVNIIGKDI